MDFFIALLAAFGVSALIGYLISLLSDRLIPDKTKKLSLVPLVESGNLLGSKI